MATLRSTIYLTDDGFQLQFSREGRDRNGEDNSYNHSVYLLLRNLAFRWSLCNLITIDKHYQLF
jgi:hypothetical protein